MVQNSGYERLNKTAFHPFPSFPPKAARISSFLCILMAVFYTNKSINKFVFATLPSLKDGSVFYNLVYTLLCFTLNVSIQRAASLKFIAVYNSIIWIFPYLCRLFPILKKLECLFFFFPALSHNGIIHESEQRLFYVCVSV